MQELVRLRGPKHKEKEKHNPSSSPFSHLLLSAKSFAPDYARCKFDGSGLPAPPFSFLPPPFYTQNKSLMRGPMRAPSARDTFIN